MTREIKFRAWLGETGGMVQDVSFDAPSGWANGNGVTYLQFTGLTDKHGTDVYEGDIVRCPVNGDSTDYLLIEAGNKDFVIREITIPEIYQEGLPDDCEVIGNVYENGLAGGKS